MDLEDDDDLAEERGSSYLVEELLSLDEVPVSFQNALVVNQIYQSEISEAIADIENALKSNLEQQERVAERMRRLQSLSSTSNCSEDGDTNPLGSSRNGLHVFAKPYFKDIRGFTHPSNEDTLAKRANCPIPDVLKCKPREWTNRDKNKLVLAVREDALRQLMRPLLEEKASISKLISAKRDSHVDSEEDEESRAQCGRAIERLKAIRNELHNLQCTNDKQLFSMSLDQRLDWLRISGEVFNCSISPRSCQLMWTNLLHPKFNKGRWNPREDKVLIQLVEDRRNKCGRWNEIADELGTNRSGLQCLMRFQQKHRKGREVTRWTKEEDSKLRVVVELLRLDKFVPWAKVSHFMSGRSREQCYQRYQCSLRDQLRKGKFSETEDILILVGVKAFGTSDWARIADFIPTRTASQLHSRYNCCLRGDPSNWSIEEDTKLLQLVKDRGISKWSVIGKEMSRGRTECKRRYLELQKLFLKDPNTFDESSLTNKSQNESTTASQDNVQEDRKKAAQKALEEFVSFKKEKQEQRTIFEARSAGCLSNDFGMDEVNRKDLIQLMFSLRRQLPKVDQCLSLSSLLSRKHQVSTASIPLKLTTEKGIGVKRKSDVLCDRHQDSSSKALGDPILSLWWNCAVKTGRNFTQYNKRDISILSRSLQQVLIQLHLSHDALDNVSKKRDSHLLDTKDQQVIGHCIQNYLVKSEEKCNTRESTSIVPKRNCISTSSSPSQHSLSSSGFPIPMRQYGGQNRSQVSSPKTGLINLDYVAPNISTLLGLRALLLQNEHLCYTAGFTTLGKKRKSKVLMNGIHDNELMLNDIYLKEQRKPEGPKANKDRDELLYRRIKALFFWPAVLSSTQPEDTGRSTLFLDHTQMADTRDSSRSSPDSKKPKRSANVTKPKSELLQHCIKREFNY